MTFREFADYHFNDGRMVGKREGRFDQTCAILNRLHDIEDSTKSISDDTSNGVHLAIRLIEKEFLV